MVSGSISLRCSRFFSPFLHSTGSLSVSWEYLALPDGAGRFKQDFSGPALLNSLYLDFRVRDYHPLWLVFPGPFHYSKYSLMGLSAFARHYLRNQLRFLFLQVLRCFSSLGLRVDWSSTSQVSPFGHLRINACLQLPVAFRSLPRPSSSPKAKASPVRPYSLPFLNFLLLPHIPFLKHG